MNLIRSIDSIRRLTDNLPISPHNLDSCDHIDIKTLASHTHSSENFISKVLFGCVSLTADSAILGNCHTDGIISFDSNQTSDHHMVMGVPVVARGSDSSDSGDELGLKAIGNHLNSFEFLHAVRCQQ